MIQLVIQKKKVNEYKVHYWFKEQVIYMWSFHLNQDEHGIMLKGSQQNNQQTEKLLYHLGIYESPEGIDYI